MLGRRQELHRGRVNKHHKWPSPEGEGVRAGKQEGKKARNRPPAVPSEPEVGAVVRLREADTLAWRRCGRLRFYRAEPWFRHVGVDQKDPYME